MLLSIFLFQTNISVCVEIQDANFLFQKYVEEESTSWEPSSLWGKQRMRDLGISHIRTSLRLPGSWFTNPQTVYV